MKRTTCHLLDDPCLAPYAEAVRGRAAHADRTARRLAGSIRNLADWASAHEYYGLHRTADGWTFREWAPNASAIWLKGDFSKWQLKPRFALKRLPGTDVWEGRFPARAFRHGQHYLLEMQWPGGRGERIPAYARRVVQDPETLLFSAQVWCPKPYEWKHATLDIRHPTSGNLQSSIFNRQSNRAPRIYEAHVGMAQEEGKVGSYTEFKDRILPRIRAAGYDTVQLMAVMEHPYYGSFGYHVSSFFAASSRFGTPEELKALVDAAHGMGLRVIMDIVHSHAVRNERDGLSLFDGTPYQYFHDGPRGWHSAWDSRCFDYGKTDVLHFLLSNCRYWLDEFRFDGYRFDGVTSMLYLHHGLGTDFTGYPMYFDGSVDEDAWAYLRLANRVIHAVRPDAITIAEDVSGMPGCAAPIADCGMGFDFRMAMGVPDKWFRLADMRDEDWGMGDLFHTLTDRRREERVVSYVESHDQALVGGKTFFFTLADSAIYYGMGKDQHAMAVDRAVALHKMARLATLGCAWTGYLNFMGNEFGHPEWIDFPRVENGWSYDHARRQWSLRDDPNLQFKALGDFDERIMSLAAERGLLAAKEPVCLAADDGDKVLAFWRAGLLFAFNFNPSKSFTDYGVLALAGRYRLVMDTDETRFGGQGRIAAGQMFFTEATVENHERVDRVKLYLPARTALVLEFLAPGIS